MVQRQTQAIGGGYQDWLLAKATGEIITVEKPPNADGRITGNWDRDEAHIAAGHADGDVFIVVGERRRVARTPRIQEFLERGELIEVEDEGADIEHAVLTV